jgi:hypothetical protein
MAKIYEIMPDIQGEEMLYLQNLTKNTVKKNCATLLIFTGHAGKTRK